MPLDIDDMPIEEAFEQMFQAQAVIQKYFAYDGNDCPIDFPLNLDLTWGLIGKQQINYAFPDEKIEKWDDMQYSVEIRKLIECEEYTAAYVDDGCGNEYWMILANSNRRTDLEEEEWE